MGSNLVRLTDKAYMTELEERIREVNEENLNKRITSRVMDEMERLKRLILVGKTPLKECPPELFHHPVFVFWRMVNREVNRASKRRADIYYRKLKAAQKLDLSIAEEQAPEEVVDSKTLTPEELLAKCREEMENQKQLDLERGVRFTDEQFAQLKYETNDIKTLKNLTVCGYTLFSYYVTLVRH
uniref:SFRICE_004099 n=1 Tax=Spodoptera frugiperda TaxID=7108 RepID=A0A2H1VTN0_SPOFR